MSTSDNPLRDLVMMQERMNRLLEESLPRAQPREASTTELAWNPDVDIVEDDDAIHFYVDLPGVGQDDIRLDVDVSSLTIEGERRPPDGVNLVRARQRERYYGTFVRRFEVGPIDMERVTARYGDGVLLVTVPKQSELVRRRVAIVVEE